MPVSFVPPLITTVNGLQKRAATRCSVLCADQAAAPLLLSTAMVYSSSEAVKSGNCRSGQYAR